MPAGSSPLLAGLARSAWGCLVLLAALSVAAVWTPGAGRLGGAVEVLHATSFALGSAVLWTLPALPVALVLAAALPGLSAPLSALRRGELAPALARRTTIGVAVLVALELGAGAAAVHWSEHHDVDHAIARAAAGVTAAVLAAGCIGLALRRRSVPPRVQLLVAAGPLAAPLLLLAWSPAHLLAHGEVGWSLALAAALPFAARVPSPRSRRAVAVFLVICVLSALHLALGFGARPGLAAALTTRHLPIRDAVAIGRRLTDPDGDGSSAWFGGRDCAPADPRRGPGGVEIAGNGVDDNCLLGDLADDAEPVAPPTGARGLAWARPPSVLVLSVDALRPDRMSIHGYPRPTTPRIAGRFAGAVRFDAAYSESASTRDTLPSLLTGRRREELVWHRHRAVALDPDTPTAAHLFAARGYRTIAVLPFVALNMIGGTDLGFSDTSIYDERRPNSAAAVNARLLAAIARGGGGPFFAIAHYYEPHEPYRRHLAHGAVSGDPYDQEIAAVDAAIGDLLATLDARGLGGDTIVVLTGDHGEAFGEHGHYFHNEGVYEEDVRVPWLLKIPGVPARAVATPVSTTALVATLHDVLGWPLPVDRPPTVASVWPLVLGEAAADERVVCIARATLGRERLAVIRGPHKILFDRELGAFELFDLAADPGELQDLGARDPRLADRMVADAADVLEHVFGAAASRRARALAHDELPARARPAPEGAPVGVVGAWAELTRGLDGSGLPLRVLVHTLVVASPPTEYEVVLLDGETVAQRVAGAPEGVDGRRRLHDDIRTFKVLAEDADQVVELRQGRRRWSLGPVRALPVGAPRRPDP